MAKNKKQKQTQPVPDAQAIPGIKGPKDYDAVVMALKMKCHRVFGTEGIPCTVSIPQEQGEAIEVEALARILKSSNGSTFTHVLMVTELQAPDGTVVEPTQDKWAVELYEGFKEYPTGRAPTPVLDLPDEIMAQMEQIKQTIVAQLPKKDQDAIKAGRAYLKETPQGFKLAYTRERKSKQEAKA